MSIDDQIPTHLEPGFLHGDVFLVEFSQAAQEVPQHWRIDEVGRPFHLPHVRALRRPRPDKEGHPSMYRLVLAGAPDA